MDDPTARQLEAATNGKYRVERLIGRGGMGTVYLGVHHELGSRVAIKVLPPDFRDHPDRLARFRREAAVAANLSHPNLVPVFELETSTDLIYLVMPYVDGETLDQWLARQGRLSWPETVDLVSATGAALGHAHERGVIHRDIKPANLLREGRSGRWMVTDFGVAHVAEPSATALTHSEATIGTFAYMAPEQLGGARHVDGRADLYSLATVAFEALTGEIPEREGVERARRQLASLRPDLTGEQVRAITAPLAEARDERPASVTDWLASLQPGRRPRLFRPIVRYAVPALAVAAFAVVATRRQPVPERIPSLAVLPFPLETDDTALAGLDSILPQLLTWEIQQLPGYRVLEDTRVRTALRGRFGAGTPPPDSLFAFAATRLGADQVVVGQATALAGGDSVRLRIEVFDAGRRVRLDGGEHTGPPSRLSEVISEVVIDAFAARLASEWSGAPSIPATLPAIVAYFEGDRAFRRGALEEALRRFNETIALDSTYAPAYLKRILAAGFSARPTEAITDVRTAVAQAAAYREDLDPASRRLLEAFTAAAIRGDLREADRLTRELVDDYPDAIDAWFLMGALRTIFPSLTGASSQEARRALDQVLVRDPTFVAAYGLMIQLAIADNRPEDARTPIARFLAVDSTSTNAQLVRLTDSLLRFPSRVGRIASTLPGRPRQVLENLALVTAELHPPSGGRAIGAAAIDALRGPALSSADRTLAFRLRMATDLGSGEFAAARTLLRTAAATGVDPGEVDRWRVLGAATAAEPLVGADEADAAATRLLQSGDAPLIDHWLAARLALRAGRPAPAVRDRFDRLAAAAGPDSVLARGLRADLDALTLLARGDTAAALNVWQVGLERVAIERVLFGLVGSLWPLRADLVLTAYAAGADSLVRRIGGQFDRRLGILDQVVWEPVMLARAGAARRAGDPIAARRRYEELLRIWEHGAPHPRRDSLQALVDGLASQR